MAKAKTDDTTVTCPDCSGNGTKPGGRYTEPDIVCPTCDGAQVVTPDVAEKFAPAEAEEPVAETPVEEPTPEPEAHEEPAAA